MAFGKKEKAESLLEKYIKEGDKLDIETIERPGKEIEKRQYRSMVYDIVSEDQIKIAMPIEQGKVILLPVDGEYNLCFYTKSGLYQCLSRVIERSKVDNVFVLLMELTTDLSKYQRREYYRLNVMLPITFITLDERAGTLERMAEIRQLLEERREELLIGEGTILNISGGGVRFISDTEIGDAKYLFMRFAIEAGEENRTIALIGELVAKELTEDKKHNAYRVRILFKDSRCQEMIIRYIFDQERKIRRKELGG